MAEVFFATQQGPLGFRKPCVVKRILPALRNDPEFRERFVREARVAALLMHPNIVQVFELIEADEGELFLAMEFVDGAPIHDLRARLPRQKLPPWAVARIGWAGARALDHAHRTPSEGTAAGLIHRDVSPQNVLASRLGEIKLIDFGIAKAADAAHTLSLLGKPSYFAPEQARGGPLDARTDVFALGVTLFEALTGALPFAGKGPQYLEELKTGSAPAPLACDLEAEVPLALAEAIDVALQRKAERRYPSASAMADAFEVLVRAEREHGDAAFESLVREALGPSQPELIDDLGDGPSTPERPAGTANARNAAVPPRRRWLVVAGVGAMGGAVALGAAGRTGIGVTKAADPIARPVAGPTDSVLPTLLRPVPPSAVPPAPTSKRESTPRPATKVPLVAVQFRARPYASLELDGQPAAEVDPFVQLEVPSGKHRALFRYGSTVKTVDFTASSGPPQLVEAAFPDDANGPPRIAEPERQAR